MSFEHHPRRGAAWEPDAAAAVNELTDGSVTRELVSSAAPAAVPEARPDGSAAAPSPEPGAPDEPAPEPRPEAGGAGAESIGGWELMQRGWASGDRDLIDPTRALALLWRRARILARRLWRRVTLRRAQRALPTPPGGD